MKIVNPNVELLPISTTYDEMLRDIERAAEICVASTKHHDPIDDYINSLIKRKHYRTLEFGTVYVEVPVFRNSILIKEQHIENYFWKKVMDSPWTRKSPFNENLITTNCRVLQEVQDEMQSKKDMFYLTLDMCDWKKYAQKRWRFTNQHKLRYTFLWEVSRATADSFRTYVSISSLMQSTRYCNFSSNKFGGEITYVRPNWWEHDYETTPQNEFTPHEHLFIRAWKNAEDYYLSAITLGMEAQHARGVLPLDIRTEFIQCAYGDDWQNFFDQRAHNSTGPAHDDAQLISTKAEKLWIEHLEKEVFE